MRPLAYWLNLITTLTPQVSQITHPIIQSARVLFLFPLW